MPGAKLSRVAIENALGAVKAAGLLPTQIEFLLNGGFVVDLQEAAELNTENAHFAKHANSDAVPTWESIRES